MQAVCADNYPRMASLAIERQGAMHGGWCLQQRKFLVHFMFLAVFFFLVEFRWNLFVCITFNYSIISQFSIWKVQNGWRRHSPKPTTFFWFMEYSTASTRLLSVTPQPQFNASKIHFSTIIIRTILSNGDSGTGRALIGLYRNICVGVDINLLCFHLAIKLVEIPVRN